MRVQIPAYTDRWMMGDRYGVVLTITRHRERATKKLPVANAMRAAMLTGDRFAESREIARVKLDKSGKTVRVILADCAVA